MARGAPRRSRCRVVRRWRVGVEEAVAWPRRFFRGPSQRIEPPRRASGIGSRVAIIEGCFFIR